MSNLDDYLRLMNRAVAQEHLAAEAAEQDDPDTLKQWEDEAACEAFRSAVKAVAPKPSIPVERVRAARDAILEAFNEFKPFEIAETAAEIVDSAFRELGLED